MTLLSSDNTNWLCFLQARIAELEEELEAERAGRTKASYSSYVLLFPIAHLFCFCACSIIPQLYKL